MRYPLSMRNDHVFVEIEEANWLIDTGSPASFGGAITFGAHYLRLPKTMMGGLMGGQLSPEYLSKETGISCCGLLGNDVLGRYNLKFDFPNGVLELYEEETSFFSEKSCSFTTVMGVPLLQCRIMGKTAKLLLDTGATICYVQDEGLHQYPIVGTKEDFYPMMGRFTSNLYIVDIACCNWSLGMKTGSLPGILGAAVRLIADGILGNESMKDRVFLYGFSSRRCEWV